MSNSSSEMSTDLTTPICKDCKFCRPYTPTLFGRWFGIGIDDTCYELAVCTNPRYIPPKPEKNIMSGRMAEHLPHMYCSVMRMKGPYSNSCGAIGGWFEPKEIK
jgi:hypothetical protein